MSNVCSFSNAQAKKSQSNKAPIRSKYYDNTKQAKTPNTKQAEIPSPFIKVTWNGFSYLPGFWFEQDIPLNEIWNDDVFDPEPNFPSCG
jgi:hypothetical protein